MRVALVIAVVALAWTASAAGDGTSTRGCGTRGEPSAEPHRTDVVIGSTRWHSLRGLADAPASEFASLADQEGFTRLSPEDQARLLPLARTHYGLQKTPLSVRAGRRVTVAIARADRPHAAFFFGRERGRRVGPYYSSRVSDGTSSVRFVACAAREPRFSAPGQPVGPWTTYPGAMLVAGARCVTIEVRERGRRTARRDVGFGVRCARPGDPAPAGAPR